MEIITTKEDSTLTIALVGRLDTKTAPELESELKSSLDGVTELVIDLTDLEYISSAGLRVLLSAQKCMMEQGSMVVKGVNETVMDIFELTGLSDVLTIEPAGQDL